MSLIHCSDCKKEVSDQATSCVHCGSPISTGGTFTHKFGNGLAATPFHAVAPTTFAPSHVVGKGLSTAKGCGLVVGGWTLGGILLCFIIPALMPSTVEGPPSGAQKAGATAAKGQSDSQDGYKIKPGAWTGAWTKEDFELVARFAAERDFEAFKKINEEGRAFPLVPGTAVHISEMGGILGNGGVKVRERGTTTEYWIPMEALE